MENSVSNDFWSMLLDSIGAFNCHLPCVILHRNIQAKIFNLSMKRAENSSFEHITSNISFIGCTVSL